MEDGASGGALGTRVRGQAIDLRVICLPLLTKIYTAGGLSMLL